MGCIPILSDKNIKNIQRVLGENPKFDLTHRNKKNRRLPPTFQEDAPASSGSDVVIAEIAVGDPASGYIAYLYENGIGAPPTRIVTIFITEIGLCGTLPSGTRVLAHLTQLAITGGND